MTPTRRHTIRKLADLLPEVLIEAQGCDEITARAALTRAYEGLCVEYGFCEETMWLTVHKEDLAEDGCVHLSLDRQNVLQITEVSRKGANHTFLPIPFTYDGREVVIPHLHLPSDLERNGHGVGLRVKVQMMPDVDEDLKDVAMVTKWRNLIVAKTLEDLFSMEGQRWTSAARYQLYAAKAEKLVESFLITERHFGGVAQSRCAAASPAFNVFC